jgi:uncharacterized membrane protein YbaN (DUF454 family)
MRRTVRLLGLALAAVSLALAAVGVVVPVLPTTPFVLVAAFAAARSSPRLHAWILRHRVFGPVVRDWRAHRAVSRRAKATASATMAVSAAVLFLASPSRTLAVAATAFMAAVASWLWLRPEPPGA